MNMGNGGRPNQLAWYMTPQGMEMGVREMEEYDLPAVTQMVQEEGWVKSVPMAMAVKSMSPRGALVAVDSAGHVMAFATSVNMGASDTALLYILVGRNYRKLGLGKELVKVVEKNAGNRVVSLLSVPGAVRFYQDMDYNVIDNMGVVVSFMTIDYSQLSALPSDSSSNVLVVDAKSIPLSKLVAYDQKVVGYNRLEYLVQVLFPEAHRVMVALDTETADVIGYCGASLVGESLSVAPLYADDDSVALELFTKAVLTCRAEISNFDTVKVHCPKFEPFLRGMGQVKRQVVCKQMATGEMGLKLSKRVYSYINTCFP